MMISNKRRVIFALLVIVAISISIIILALLMPSLLRRPEVFMTEYAYATRSVDAKSLTYVAKNYTLRIDSDKIELLSRGSGNGVNGTFFNVNLLSDGNITEFISDEGHEGVIMRQGGKVKKLGAGEFYFKINKWTLHLLILKFRDKYSFDPNINAIDDNLPLTGEKLIIANVSLSAFGYFGSKEFSPEVVREVIVYTTDAEGVAKDTFSFGDDVYCYAKGLLPSYKYKIWIQPDPVQELDILSPDKDPSNPKTQEIYQTNESGCLSTLIWANASSSGDYDVVIDRIGEKEGIYNALNDGIDSPVGAGFTVSHLELEEVQLPEELYGLELNAYPEYNEVFPGVEATYFIEIRNTGKVNDTYDISCENTANVDFIYIDKKQACLKADESTIVKLILRERDTGEYIVNVIAKSRGDPDVTASVSISLKVKKRGGGGGARIKAKIPVVTVCDKNGTEKSVFGLDESVYFRAEGLPGNKHLDISVVPNREWGIGDPIGEDVTNDGINTVLTDDYGKLPTVEIWAPPLTAGKYDVVVDINQNGRLDEGEPVDDFTATAGFEVIPEFLTVAIPIVIVLIIFMLFQRGKKCT